MGWEEGSGGDIIVNSDLCLRVVHFFFVCVLKGVGKQADHDSFIFHRSFVATHQTQKEDRTFY